MSKYKEITVEFRSKNSLMQALAEMGFTDNIVKVTDGNDQNLIGYLGDTRPETAAIRIPRQYVGSGANDIGFALVNGRYNLIISDFDSRPVAKGGFDVNRLRQGYAKAELFRNAKINGYNVRKLETTDGTLQYELVRR